MKVSALLILSLTLIVSMAAPASSGLLSRFTVLESDGKVVKATQPQAAALCSSLGLRLPTVREFAALSMSLGAIGILKPVPKGSPAPQGSYLVASVNPGNQLDEVLFSHEGYEAPVGPLGIEPFWTASIAQGHPQYAHVYYGSFGGGGGLPHEHHLEFLNAVACVSGLD